MPGLNDFLTVQEDTDVRTKSNTPDSMKNYDINMPSLAPYQEIYTPPADGFMEQIKDDALNVGMVSPDAFSMNPFEFEDIQINMPTIETPTIETRIENLQLDTGGINPVSAFASNILNNEDASEQEQTDAVNLALLEKELPLDFLDPATVKFFKKYGIDLEQRQRDYEARKEGGQPFIDAGLALTQASRAGLNVPQAITSAMATFTASKNKLNELDPLMLQIALAMLPKPTGVGDIEGEFDMFAGEEYLGTRHLTDAMVLRMEADGIDLRPVATGENATTKYYVQEKDGWVLKNLGDVAYQNLVDEKGYDKVQQYDQVAERQIVSVYDKDNDTFDSISLAQYHRDKADEPDRFSVETGDIVKAEYLGDDTDKFKVGDTKDVSKSWLASNPGWSEVPNAAYRVSMVNGVPQFSNVPSSIAGALALEESVAKEYTDKNVAYLQTTNQNMGQMAVTVGQVSTALDELDGRGGSAVRMFERLKDTYIGGAREIMGLYNVDVAPSEILTDKASGKTLVESEAEFRDTFKQMDNDGMFGMLNGLGGEERAAAALSLENALFSLALQNAMNSYDQTARSISDRDLQFFLRNIGASAGSTPTLVRALTDEIERSTLVKFDKGVQNMIYYQPTINDKDRTKPLVRDGYLVLKEGADPTKRDSYELDPNNPTMKTRIELENALGNLSLKHGRIVPRTNTSFTGGNVFMERLGIFAAENKNREFTREGQTYTLAPGQLNNKIDLTDAVLPTSGAGQQELSNAFSMLADSKEPTLKAILNAYNSAVFPKIQKLTDAQDDTGASKRIASQIHNEFLNVFLPRDEDKKLFDDFMFGITYTQ